MNIICKISVAAMLFLMTNLSYAQETTVSSKTDPKTGVRTTTIVKTFPSLSEQVADCENKLAAAEKDPVMIQNGTVEKYKLLLIRLKNELEVENAERRRIEAAENK